MKPMSEEQAKLIVEDAERTAKSIGYVMGDENLLETFGQFAVEKNFTFLPGKGCTCEHGGRARDKLNWTQPGHAPRCGWYKKGDSE